MLAPLLRVSFTLMGSLRGGPCSCFRKKALGPTRQSYEPEPALNAVEGVNCVEGEAEGLNHISRQAGQGSCAV